MQFFGIPIRVREPGPDRWNESLTRQTEQNNPVVYLVEPDQEQREALTALLLRTGFRAFGFTTAEDLLAAQGFPAQRACVVSELKLPGLDGLTLLQQLRQRNAGLPFIMLTAETDLAAAVSALHNKVSDYLVKPVVERELVQRIKAVLRGPEQAWKLAESG